MVENVYIVSGATSYDEPMMGTTTNIAMSESMYCTERLDNIRINLNYFRNYGIEFFENPYDKYRNMFTAVYDQLKIPLHRKGTKGYLNTRKMKMEDLESYNHTKINRLRPW